MRCVATKWPDHSLRRAAFLLRSRKDSFRFSLRASSHFEAMNTRHGCESQAGLRNHITRHALLFCGLLIGTAVLGNTGVSAAPPSRAGMETRPEGRAHPARSLLSARAFFWHAALKRQFTERGTPEESSRTTVGIAATPVSLYIRGNERESGQ